MQDKLSDVEKFALLLDVTAHVIFLGGIMWAGYELVNWIITK